MRYSVVGACESPELVQGGAARKVVMRTLNSGGKMHGRGRESKEKVDSLVEMIEREGRTDVLAMQHTGVTTMQDGKRLMIVNY